jgi:hypothetical protein
VCIFSYHDLQPRALQSRKWQHLCKRWSVSNALIKPNVWNECIDIIGLSLERTRLPSHPFVHFTNSSVRHIVCVNGKFPLLQNVRMVLEYQPDVCRVTSSAYVEHLSVVKWTLTVVVWCLNVWMLYLAWFLQNKFLKLWKSFVLMLCIYMCVCTHACMLHNYILVCEYLNLNLSKK